MHRRPLPALFGRSVTRIHCVGVGGMGVGPLALYLAALGFHVTGEDDGLAPEMNALLGRGGVAVGPMLANTELVVYSSAIAASHPALATKDAEKIPRVRRGEMLAEVTRDRKLVAICGSHGKTTTTAMLITALRRANFPAGYVLGGLFADGATPAAAGANEWVVAEIDESDGTIERFSPEVTVAVNLDWDHPDFYRQPADLEAAFAALFARTRGAVLLSSACAMSARMGAPRAVTFGAGGDFAADLCEDDGSHLGLKLAGKFSIARARVRAAGRFNAANATAALAAAQLIGATLTPGLLEEFPGVRRRQTLLSSAGDIAIVEDYAHHPAEIRALLESLRGRVASGGRLIVAFQPHRFSRTAQFKAEFARALGLADRVLLLDVYAAGEAPLDGGTAGDLHRELLATGRKSPAITYHPKADTGTISTLSTEVHRGDVVAFVGAGDIDRKAREWLAQWGNLP